MISKNSLKIAAVCGAFVLGATAPAEALWPFCNSCGGFGYQGAPGYGYGTYTSFYGPTQAYGYNPFAPLVPNPYCGGGCRTSFFGLGRNSCGCSPCGGGCSTGNCSLGNCATGNCSLSTTNQPLKPSPDNPPSTYDNEKVPMDDKGFGPAPETETELDGLGRESFKVPMKVDDATGVALPMDKTPPVDVKEEEKKKNGSGTLEAPKPQTFTAPNLIDPRNSAQLEQIRNLEHKITWREEPVVVRTQPVVQTSRPLVVRRMVRTGGTSQESSLLTQSTSK